MGNKLGLDVGTNLLVSARVGEDGSPIFKSQRDAFYKILPKSEVNKNAIRSSLEKKTSWVITPPVNWGTKNSNTLIRISPPILTNYIHLLYSVKAHPRGATSGV